ncbi:YciI family protein [Lysobacter panacisoli]|uniref:YciI family protein n=1 Tax=Lysobacter panacisoli TaxID=1255263 RepID=A0ABP9LTB4_9GAMM|nr:YciI family protein [Lysobacter panacisoli]
MKFLLMVYTDPVLMDALPEGEFERLMRGCLQKADELRAAGVLLDSQQLEEPTAARSLRTRNGSTAVLDGPFAEAKEVFAGFNLIEAADIEEAVRIAHSFPWSRTGSIEVRPVRDMDAVRVRVGA